MRTLIPTLESLLASIQKYQSSPAKYDEWRDTNPCSILTDIESPSFGPLFNKYREIQSKLAVDHPAVTLVSQSIRLDAPKREVVFDDYGQQYVSYYFTSAHLNELATAIQELLDALSS